MSPGTAGRRAIPDALARAHAAAPFLRHLIDSETGLVDVLAAGVLPLPAALRIDDPDMPVARRLRIERRRLALMVAIGDLAGAYDLTAVTAALSAFADYALDSAIAQAIHERTPGAPVQGLAAIALGKQGSHELNYSSDIDPILLFDPATLPCRAREEPEDAAVRIGRRVIELLQARDVDGYVLRVDLRLRPSPEVSPIVLPVDAAISHYESQAVAWERAAFIRARPASGDVTLGQRFLDAVQPFIWRRGLDFGAIAEIRGMSRRIRDHHAQGQVFGPGFDLKRGRGGIREVEFFAQIHQMIHGGRDVSLRTPATRDALWALAERGVIAPDDATALVAAYTALRTIEHRVQMIDDRQTHTLPPAAALDAVARLDGRSDGAALVDMLRPHVTAVATTYDALEPERETALSRDPVRLKAALSAAGFDDGQADAAVTRLQFWRSDSYPALRSVAARSALESVLPGLVAAFGTAPDPGEAMLRLDRILAKLPSAINFFRLLEARPPLARLLGTILCHAPPLADALGRRPALLDGLIDASALDPVGDIGSLVAQLRPLHGRGDYQALLDHVRQVVGELRFALGAQLVAGVADPLAVAGGYARIAEAAIEVLAAATVDDFARRHGRVPGSELVVLALGRLGGGALTHASDLDLIYLFTGDYAAESDGEKPLGAVHYYNRLAQRLSAALSVPTASGALYDIDTRLRPSGAQGPLAVSTDGFARYQRESAWTWEHMALTRARPVFGAESARQSVREDVRAIVLGARQAHDVIADARAMRADITMHKPAAGPLDVKLLPGGLVDLEFAVHVTQLTRGVGLTPMIGDAIGDLTALGWLPAGLGAAHDFLMRLLVTVRLVAPDAQPPTAATQALIAQVMDAPDWARVIANLGDVRHCVSDAWQAIAEG